MDQLDKIQTPEEKELHEKELELNRLQNVLSKKELELATLENELNSFNIRYLKTVGSKFAELDKLYYQIAKLQSTLNPDNSFFSREAKAAKKKAKESFDASNLENDEILAEKFKPSEDLRLIYRKLSKLVHPDLTDNSKERKKRNLIMAEVNKAFSEGNIERLQEIFENWKSSPDHIKGDDIGSRLVRIIRMITRVKNRLIDIDNEINSFMSSETHKLFIKAMKERENGNDLLSRMALKIDKKIEEAMKELFKLRNEYDKK